MTAPLTDCPICGSALMSATVPAERPYCERCGREWGSDVTREELAATFKIDRARVADWLQLRRQDVDADHPLSLFDPDDGQRVGRKPAPDPYGTRDLFDPEPDPTERT